MVGVLLTGLPRVACSVCFHLSRGDAALGLVSSWLTMKMPTGQSDGDSFLIDFPSSWVTLVCHGHKN